MPLELVPFERQDQSIRRFFFVGGGGVGVWSVYVGHVVMSVVMLNIVPKKRELRY